MRYLICFFLLASAAFGQDTRVALSSDGWIFDVTQNANGFVFRTQQDMARYTEAGANSQWAITPVTIFVGKSCDTFSPELGEGRWEWANGGFIITAGGRRFAFPRQEPPLHPDATGCSS